MAPHAVFGPGRGSKGCSFDQESFAWAQARASSARPFLQRGWRPASPEPDPFVLITPDWVPYPRLVIEATGVCELAGAVGLLLPRFRAFAGIMLALYAVCVFPANLKHAVDGIAVPGLPQSWWYHAVRLALQPVIVWWALFAAGVIDWPWRNCR